MESWNGGMMGLKNKEKSFFFWYPVFQYSIVPIFHH
jgi:hypothetical protein